MPDLIRERFDALRGAVERTEAAGLHDVRVRRSRRSRNQVAAATAAVISALAIGGVLVLPQTSPDTTSTAGGAEVLSDSAGDVGDEQADADESVAAEQAPNGPPNASEGPFTLTADSLLTAPELLAVGEQNPQPQVGGSGPVLPPLCDARTGAEQYSDPLREVSVQFAVLDATLRQYAAEYNSESVATQAMDRLLLDTRSCPQSADGGRVDVSSPTPGEVLVLTFTEPFGGPTGGPRLTEITVLRAANVIFEVALVPSLMGLADGESRTRAVAESLVAKL